MQYVFLTYVCKIYNKMAVFPFVALKRKLMMRRSVTELVDQGIYPRMYHELNFVYIHHLLKIYFTVRVVDCIFQNSIVEFCLNEIVNRILKQIHWFIWYTLYLKRIRI